MTAGVAAPTDETAAATGEASAPDAADAAASANSSFKPTRRVREAPGGAHHDIFGTVDDDDALAGAPPKVNF